MLSREVVINVRLCLFCPFVLCTCSLYIDWFVSSVYCHVSCCMYACMLSADYYFPVYYYYSSTLVRLRCLVLIKNRLKFIDQIMSC